MGTNTSIQCSDHLIAGIDAFVFATAGIGMFLLVDVRLSPRNRHRERDAGSRAARVARPAREADSFSTRGTRPAGFAPSADRRIPRGSVCSQFAVHARLRLPPRKGSPRDL